MRINPVASILIIAAAIGLGFVIGKVYSNPEPPACNSADNLTNSKPSFESRVRLEWNAAERPASAYTVLVYEVSGTDTTLFKSYEATGTSFDLNELQPFRQYLVRLLSRCGSVNGGDILPDVLQTEFNTFDWIIVDDVVHVQDQDKIKGITLPINTLCGNFDQCTDVAVTNVAGGSTFNWPSTGKEFYTVSITATGASTPDAVALLEKDFINSGAKTVRSHKGVNCRAGFLDVNSPLDSLCTPAAPSNAVCSPSTSPVAYQIAATSTGCMVTVPAGYTVSVQQCQ